MVSFLAVAFQTQGLHENRGIVQCATGGMAECATAVLTLADAARVAKRTIAKVALQ